MPSGVEAQPVPSISPLAGLPAREMLVDVARLEREYFECRLSWPTTPSPVKKTWGDSIH
jgi:hypothetical protein